eukprot:Awhi_evm2s5534
MFAIKNRHALIIFLGLFLLPSWVQSDVLCYYADPLCSTVQSCGTISFGTCNQISEFASVMATRTENNVYNLRTYVDPLCQTVVLSNTNVSPNTCQSFPLALPLINIVQHVQVLQDQTTASTTIETQATGTSSSTTQSETTHSRIESQTESASETTSVTETQNITQISNGISQSTISLLFCLCAIFVSLEQYTF